MYTKSIVAPVLYYFVIWNLTVINIDDHIGLLIHNNPVFKTCKGQMSVENMRLYLSHELIMYLSDF